MKFVLNTTIEEIVNGLFDLAPNMYVMIATLLSVIILTFLMKKLVWNPVMKLMDERSQMVHQELEDAKAANAEAVKLKEDANEKIQTAIAQSSDIIGKAKTTSSKIRMDEANRAKAQAANIIAQAKQEIETAKRRLASEVKQEIVDVAFDAAEKIVEKHIDRSEKDILNDFVSKLEESKDESK